MQLNITKSSQKSFSHSSYIRKQYDSLSKSSPIAQADKNIKSSNVSENFGSLTRSRQMIVDAINDDEKSTISCVMMRNEGVSNKLIDSVHEKAIFSNVESNADKRYDYVVRPPAVNNSGCAVNERVPCKSRSPDPDVHESKLYTFLKKGDTVLAKYNYGPNYVKAVILSVSHGGYTSARYDVKYADYSKDNISTVSWEDIKLVGNEKDTIPVGRDTEGILIKTLNASACNGNASHASNRDKSPPIIQDRISQKRSHGNDGSDESTSASDGKDAFGRDVVRAPTVKRAFLSAPSPSAFNASKDVADRRDASEKVISVLHSTVFHPSSDLNSAGSTAESSAKVAQLELPNKTLSVNDPVSSSVVNPALLQRQPGGWRKK